MNPRILFAHALLAALLAAWWWLRAPREPPPTTTPEPPRPTARVHSPFPLAAPVDEPVRAEGPRTPEERAREAVAEAVGGYVIRCRIPDLGGRVPALSRGLGEPGDAIIGGVLTTIVGEPEGNEILYSRLDPDSGPGDFSPKPHARIEWRGAAPGRINPCRVQTLDYFVTDVELHLWEGAPAVRSWVVDACSLVLGMSEAPLTVEVPAQLGPCAYRASVSFADGRVARTEDLQWMPAEAPAVLEIHLTEADLDAPGPVPPANLDETARALRSTVEDGPVQLALERDDLDPEVRAVLEGWSRSGAATTDLLLEAIER